MTAKTKRTEIGQQHPAYDAPAARLSRARRSELEALLADEPHGYMDQPAFRDRDAVKRIFIDAPELPEPNCDWYHPGLDADLETRQPATTNTLLTTAQERVIFTQFNFARYRAAKLHAHMAKKGIDEALGNELLFWDAEAKRLRDRIVEFNLALVLAMARHVAAAKLDFSDLVSEGNLALLRAVDKFDVTRKFKFSTYACRAILKAFSRMSVRNARRKATFPVSFDPGLEQSDGGEVARMMSDDLREFASELHDALALNKAGLTELEQQVIAQRFPMEDDRSNNPPTLKEVGQMVGYSKERIRQIQASALAKIRQHMEEAFVEGPFEAAAV